MSQLLKNISILMLASFVLLISMGVNLSKIDCHNITEFYIGSTTSNCCEQDLANSCDKLNKSSSSTKKEVTCCPEESLTCCEKEDISLHYNFQMTLFSVKKMMNLKKINLLNYFGFKDYKLKTRILINLTLSTILSPQLLNYPVLSKIQVFQI